MVISVVMILKIIVQYVGVAHWRNNMKIKKEMDCCGNTLYTAKVNIVKAEE